jgi:plasmid stability protein
MSTTLTIRTDESLRQALRERAEAQGISLSSLVRQILEEALTERPGEIRYGHLKGKLDLPPETLDPWRRELRDRNWRP